MLNDREKFYTQSFLSIFHATYLFIIMSFKVTEKNYHEEKRKQSRPRFYWLSSFIHFDPEW